MIGLLQIAFQTRFQQGRKLVNRVRASGTEAASQFSSEVTGAASEPSENTNTVSYDG